MAIIEIKIPKGIARALNLPVRDARRQQLRVLKKLLPTACRRGRVPRRGSRSADGDAP